MYYYFVLNHPAHFHLFKFTIQNLRNNGHECDIFIRPKDVLKKLLDRNHITYKALPESARNKRSILLSSIWGLIKKDIELGKYIKKRKPDLMMGTDWSITNLGRLFKIPSLVFNEDDTIATPENKIFYPLAKHLLLPDCCDKGLWEKKRISYAGYHELAYLHPKRFNLDNEIIKKHLNNYKPYILIRLVKLTASHDKGKRGLGYQLLDKIIEKFKNNFQILISFEGDVEKQYTEYSFSFDPSLMHHFLAGAHLVIGDSQTMIAEASILGTPSIRINDFVGKLGYLEELETKYDLTFGIKASEPEKFLAKIEELLTYTRIKEEWKIRKEKMINDKIDVTAFMVWFVENYPNSFITMKKNPDYQYNFK
jgi:predicted glycosyltransferase